MEKDWLVVICKGDSTLLSQVNTNVRTIDLLCNLAAPLLAGQLLFFTSHLVTAITVCVWNIASAMAEFLLLQHIYRSHPALKMEKTSQTHNKSSTLKATLSAWPAFFNHPVRDAGLGLAFLFMNVLGVKYYTYSAPPYYIFSKLREHSWQIFGFQVFIAGNSALNIWRRRKH